jgi:zinc transporter 1/2/3
MFGSGVILATALVHMLIPSTESLTNPCLPKEFSDDYGAFSAVFCLFAMLSLHFIQFMLGKEIRKKHIEHFPETVKEAEVIVSIAAKG